MDSFSRLKYKVEHSQQPSSRNSKVIGMVARYAERRAREAVGPQKSSGALPVLQPLPPGSKGGLQASLQDGTAVPEGAAVRDRRAIRAARFSRTAGSSGSPGLAERRDGDGQPKRATYVHAEVCTGRVRPAFAPNVAKSACAQLTLSRDCDCQQHVARQRRESAACQC